MGEIADKHVNGGWLERGAYDQWTTADRGIVRNVSQRR